MIAEPAARWFESRRDELNHRFERARKRFPSLAPQPALNLMAQLVSPMAGDEPAAAELCLAVYDLVLLHCGRDRFGTHPGVEMLLREIFPQLRPLLLLSPSRLPAALSNAVENMGEQGREFCRGLRAIFPCVDTPERLLDAGAVLAWRLGEARLRTQAIQTAASLPARAALNALGLSGWPEEAAPLALASLAQNAWQHPQSRLSESTLKSIAAGTARLNEIASRLRAASAPPLAEWKIAAALGNFAGFGGAFVMPPLVLNGGTAHKFWVRSGNDFFSVIADCFGSVCRPVADPAMEIRVPHATNLMSRLAVRLASDDGNRLSSDGVLTSWSGKAQFPQMKGATSFFPLPELVAFTTEDSYRLRILAAMRPAV